MSKGRRGRDDDTQRLDPPPEVLEQSRRQSSAHVLKLTSGVVSSTGITRARDPDEDSVLVIEIGRVLEGVPQWFGFYAVADGMGGQEAGEVASRLALEAMSVAVLERLGKPWLLGDRLDVPEIRDRLRACVDDAHLRVLQHNHEGGRDMGTTLTACLILDRTLVGINVGDSRIYLFRYDQEELFRISRDQSLVQQLVEAGEISEEDVYTDPRRNIILSSLGGEAFETGSETFVAGLSEGDKVLVCSDGLWEMVRDADLQQVLNLHVDPQQCAEDLITLACMNGGNDNVSAIVVELQSRRKL
ncbi:MAG TPA: protein phosphatase 2C domain-containing protein [Candidatus Xenobia bacterium]